MTYQTVPTTSHPLNAARGARLVWHTVRNDVSLSVYKVKGEFVATAAWPTLDIWKAILPTFETETEARSAVIPISDISF